jgi:hypothetical protein
MDNKPLFIIMDRGTWYTLRSLDDWLDVARMLILEWGRTLQELLACPLDGLWDLHPEFGCRVFSVVISHYGEEDHKDASLTLGAWAQENGLDLVAGLEGVVPDPRPERWRQLIQEELTAARTCSGFVIKFIYSDEILARTGARFPIREFGLICGALDPFRCDPDLDVYQHCFNGPCGYVDEDLYLVVRTRRPPPGFYM